MGLKVLSPPFVEGRLLLRLNKLLKPVKEAQSTEHPWHLGFVCVALNIVSDSLIDSTDRLEVLGHREVSILEIDPVELLRDLDGLVELTARLVELAEQVVTAAFLVELLCIVNHV